MRYNPCVYGKGKLGLLRRLGHSILRQLPRSHFLFRVCRRFVDNYRGDNNEDIATNGELSVLRQHLPGARVVLDIGANVGNWAHLALSINPTVALHCFEPSQRTFEVLAARRFPNSVRCINAGCGAVAGTKTLYVLQDCDGANSLFQRHGVEVRSAKPEPREEQVRVVTVDGYCEENQCGEIDFIKIDVEGYELEVFKGMTKCLHTGRVRVVQFEYGGTYIDARILLMDIWDFVLSANPHYDFFKILPRGLEAVPRYSQTLENFQYSNWLIVRDDKAAKRHG